MKNIIALMVLGLCACEARPDHYDVKLMNGAPGYRLDCDVTQFSETQCDKEALRLCGGKEIMFWYSKENSRYTYVECLSGKAPR